MLAFGETGERNPVVGALVRQGPVEVPPGARQCCTIGEVIAPFGESACEVCRIGARSVFISVTAGCSI